MIKKTIASIFSCKEQGNVCYCSDRAVHYVAQHRKKAQMDLRNLLFDSIIIAKIV